MIEMQSKYDNMYINEMFMSYFALIIMFYHVKIACYQRAAMSPPALIVDRNLIGHSRLCHITCALIKNLKI